MQRIGVIPAAGEGLRLGLPYPKELYPIIRDNRYKPLAQHALENITAAGIEHVVFVINETKHQLMGLLGDGSEFGCRISYVYQDPRRRGQGSSAGLAEALAAATHLLTDQLVLFAMADTIITPVDVLSKLLPPVDEKPEWDVNLGLFHTDHPEKFGVVDHDDRGRVRRILDKQPDLGLHDIWGAIAWSPRFTRFLHEHVAGPESPDFATVLNKAVEAGLVLRATELPGATYSDLGTFEEISQIERRQR